MLVSTILAKSREPLLTLRSDSLICEAMNSMANTTYGAIIISDNGHDVLGIVTNRELWRAELIYGGIISSSHFLDRTVSEVMTRNVISCSPTEALANVKKKMARHRINQIPVIDEHGLCGMVTRKDLLEESLKEFRTDFKAERISSFLM